MTDFLFLYGTLLPGAAPPEIADAAARLRLLGGASVTGVLYDLGDFPGAVLDTGCGSRILGVLVGMPEDPAVLRALDAYEEFDPEAPAESQFVRSRTTARLADGNERECWIYIYNRDTSAAQMIESGCWNAKTSAKRESPRLCRGGSSSLTFAGVHPRNSRREPPSTREGVSGWTSMRV